MINRREYKKIIKEVLRKQDFYTPNYDNDSILNERDFYPPSDNRVWKSNFEDIEGNVYSITKQGQMYLEGIEFPKGIEKKVNNLKVGSNKLGYKGLLRYVYFSYPEFTINSKIKDEVLGE